MSLFRRTFLKTTGTLLAFPAILPDRAGAPLIQHEPGASVAILLPGRVLLGVAESFIMTGALSWRLARLGPQNTGKVIAWIGTALYAALAVGAPAGSALYAATALWPLRSHRR
jgi:hypothetical protein